MGIETAFLGEVLADDQIATGADALREHSTDWGTEDGVEPAVVVYPKSTDDVSAVLAAATDRGIPVTPYAAGTSLEGNPVPIDGGISMNMTRMDDVLAVRPADLQLDVEPGVMGPAIEEAAGEHGLFFPPLPSSGSISTIGGMIANAASGMQTVKYGEVADWVRELEVVLADGSVITVGTKAVKTSSGYNLRDVIIGSEGTLGVVTRATLELAGRPQQIRGGRALFSTLGDAAAAVTDVVQSGVDVAKVELIDSASAMMSNAYTGADLPDVPMVFLEFHANHGIDDEIAYCESVLSVHDPLEFELADEETMDTLWRARRDLAFAVRSWNLDLQPLVPGDITVPISEYGPTIEYIKSLEQEHDLLMPCFGHAGDGNVHYTVLVDPTDPEEVKRGEDAYAAIVDYALSVGGTATGEHGIGLGKREYLEREHGETAVALMQRLKDAFDPNGTLNPGKIFPRDDDWQRADPTDYQE